MTNEEKSIIRKFARGDMSLRSWAIKIWISHLGEMQDRDSPEMLFMGEIYNPCPDLALRAGYRKRLVDLITAHVS